MKIKIVIMHFPLSAHASKALRRYKSDKSKIMKVIVERNKFYLAHRKRDRKGHTHETETCRDIHTENKDTHPQTTRAHFPAGALWLFIVQQQCT